MTAAQLEREYTAFANEDTADIVWLSATDSTVELMVCGEPVVIKVPEGYPASSDYFFVETSAGSLTGWVGRLNQSVMESSPSLKFRDLLTRAFTLLKKSAAPSASCSGSSEDDEDDRRSSATSSSDADDGLEEDTSSNLQKELALLKLKKRWEKKEIEVRKQRALEDEADRKTMRYRQQTHLEKMKMESNQVFSSTAAAKILTNDLLSIMADQELLGFSAEPIDDNIYHWSVRMFGFGDDCPLAEDLMLMNERFGYNYVELEVSFVCELYPFYPPVMSLVRPRFQLFMMNKVTSFDILKLSKWDPVRDMRAVLSDVKTMLREIGRLDVDHAQNSRTEFPKGSYTALEHSLLRLQIVSETEPRAAKMYEEQLARFTAAARPVAKAVPRRDETEEPDKKKARTEYWAKGTGYGHGSDRTQGWDVKAHMAAQEEKDNQVVRVLRAITEHIRDPVDDPRDFQAVEESALIPVLTNILSNDSLLDMSRHFALVDASLDALGALASKRVFAPLLDILPNQRQSLVDRLIDLSRVSNIYLSRVTTVGPTAESELAQRFVAAAERSREVVAISRADRGPVAMATETGGGRPEDDRGKGPSLEADYCARMRRLQFGTMNIPFGGGFKHHYTKESASLVAVEKINRLAQEQSSLASSLPLSLSSSVFLRIDEDRMDFCQALITGPEDTPYDSGCFRFDVMFPDEYPNGPPKVNLDTTGKGQIRFNPNLYNCGKVCLSLLGTWRGAAGEDWNKDASTFLQVLVSIQSLIFVPEPYFNEPGYERSIGTPEGDRANRQYNEVIRVGTVKYAMIEQLKRPPPGFEDVIRAHFFLKRDRVLALVQRWLDEARADSTATGHARALESELNELRPLLASLCMPDLSKYDE